MRTVKNNVLIYFVLFLMITSCKKDDPQESEEVAKDYSNGVFMLNEGSFGQNNASITYLSNERSLSNDVYLQANGFELGDVLQSLLISGEYGYAVLNNSQKIEVFTIKDFRHVKSIDGLGYPRHILRADEHKAYISNGAFEGSIQILDLQTQEITGSISVGYGPEKMLLRNGYVYVCNSGGWAQDNTVSVIDVSSDAVVAVLTVGDRPVDIAAGAGDDVWVLCSGKVEYDENWNIVSESEASIWKLNAASNEVVLGNQIGEIGDHPLHLESNADGNVIYYLNHGIFAVDILNGDFPGMNLIQGEMGGMNVEPSSGDIWCSSVSDFTNPSLVFHYTSSGNLQDTYTAGIGTSGFVFNR